MYDFTCEDIRNILFGIILKGWLVYTKHEVILDNIFIHKVIYDDHCNFNRGKPIYIGSVVFEDDNNYKMSYPLYDLNISKYLNDIIKNKRNNNIKIILYEK